MNPIRAVYSVEVVVVVLLVMVLLAVGEVVVPLMADVMELPGAVAAAAAALVLLMADVVVLLALIPVAVQQLKP